MTTNNNRYANRETVLKGETVNLETMERTNFELTVPYVRSVSKAMEIAAETLELDEATIINPKTFEVVNVKPEPIKYNDGKVYELAYERWDDENNAKDAANKDGSNVVKIAWFEYSAQIWAINNEGNYFTEKYYDESPVSFTKVDARAFVRMSYEDNTNYKVIGLHDCVKRETPIYCVITSDNLAQCIDK